MREVVEDRAVRVEEEVLVDGETERGALLDGVVQVPRPDGVADVDDVDAGRPQLRRTARAPAACGR